MKVLVKKTILYYVHQYPMAEIPLMLWYAEFSKYTFSNFNELKKVYGNASLVGKGRVVFNKTGNDFRLVLSINFLQSAAYIIWLVSHKEYDKIDVAKIAFDTSILTWNK